MLVYFGQDHEAGDEGISSDKAGAVLTAIDKGRLAAAEKKYPDAPINRQLLYAIHKSQRNAKPTIPATLPAPR